MPLRRSESTRTTFSVFVVRKTKYQRWLGIVNVFLLLASISMIFYGLVLKLSYYMDQLGEVKLTFFLLPWSLTILGLITFCISGFGFTISTSESRPLLFTYTVLLLIVFFGQIATVFFSVDVRETIRANAIGNAVNAKVDMTRYSKPEEQAYRERWDYLHQKLRCCGGNSYNNFYEHNSSKNYTCVPTSCCLPDSGPRGSSCTGRLLDRRDARKCTGEYKTIMDTIYTRGCHTILDGMYEEDLYDLCLVYAGAGTCVVLVELVGVALAFAYAAQLHRRMKREREIHWTPGDDMTKNGITNMNMEDIPVND